MQPFTTHHEVSAGRKKPVFWFFVAGLIGLFLFFGMNAIFLGKSDSTLNPEDPARDAERVKNLADLRAENEVKLKTYAWVDRAKGSVQIPIDEAMKLVLAELSAKKPAPAYPVLDSAGNPLPAPMSAAPAESSDSLPTDSTVSSQASSNVLAAPVDPSPAKPAKTKKPANP
ncbi:MAG: hypothetical protein WCG66_05875 [bacterium]